MSDSGRIQIRVRYAECDPMGVAHHSVYPTWFEMGRTELLRSAGGSYRRMEADGTFLVVARLDIRYRSPARYDDVLTLVTTLTLRGHVKLEHAYRLTRDAEEIAVATTTLACVGADGRPRQLPSSISV